MGDTIRNFELDQQQIRTLQAEAAYFDARATAQIEATADFLKQRRESEAGADESRVYSFYAGVDERTCLQCIATVQYWARQHNGALRENVPPFTIELTSGGGSVIDGFALIDTIRDLQAKGYVINTVAKGWVASMGAVIFQAGNVRRIGKRAYLLLHEPASQLQGAISGIEDQQKFVREMQDAINTLLAERSTLSVEEIAAKTDRREWYLNAAEALKHGFADELLDEQPYSGPEPLAHHPV